jgi:hypothetical protein
MTPRPFSEVFPVYEIYALSKGRANQITPRKLAAARRGAPKRDCHFTEGISYPRDYLVSTNV